MNRQVVGHAHHNLSMAFRLELAIGRRSIAIAGFAGFLVFLGIFALPSFFAPTLDRETAEKEIRSYLRMQESLRHLEELKRQGKRIPDFQTASQWRTKLRRIEEIQFRSVEIRYSLLNLPFDTRRMFVVRTVIGDDQSTSQTRVFTLSSENKYLDFFWVAEQPGWMWHLSFRH